jgi:glycosyltransferase involved in cell wall biosynthesis
MTTVTDTDTRTANKILDQPAPGPMSIVVANDFGHVNGGAAQVALISAVGLAERGHKVVVLGAVAPVADFLEHAQAKVVLTGEFDIKNDPSRLRAATKGIWNRRAAVELRRILAASDKSKTIVHVHGWTKALTSSIVRAAIDESVPVVATMHDYFFACPNGGFFNFQRKEACHLRPLSGACLMENCDRDGYAEKLWRSARQIVQNNFGFPRSRLLNFITISDFSESVLRPFFPPEAGVYRVASPSDFVQGPPVDVTRNSVFVAMGRLSPEKGLELLAKAGQELDYEVKFVGEGPSRDSIMATNPRAQITGWQTRAHLVEHLRRARCLVLPSLWYEAQPMVIAEAAAVGVPAIVADQCAGREMLDEGVTGLLFRSGDYRDLRDKMAVMQDDCTAARMGRAAYERHWKKPFTLASHLDALEHCYRDILMKLLDHRTAK